MCVRLDPARVRGWDRGTSLARSCEVSRAPVRDSPRSAFRPALLCRGFVRLGGHVHGSSVTITSQGGVGWARVSPRARDDPWPAEAVRGGLPSPLQLHARFSVTLRNDSPSFCTPAHTDSLHSRPSSGCTAPRTWPCRGPVVADTGSSACCGRRPQMPQLRVASVLTTPGPTKRRPPSPDCSWPALGSLPLSPRRRDFCPAAATLTGHPGIP